MTAAERSPWVKLRGHRFQWQIDFIGKRVSRNYVVDFYCAGEKLILEIDGSIHFLYGKPESDLRRQNHLEQPGLQGSYVSAMKK